MVLLLFKEEIVLASVWTLDSKGKGIRKLSNWSLSSTPVCKTSPSLGEA